MMSVRVAESRGWTVLSVAGEIDMATAPRLRQAVVDAVAAGRHHVAVDLTEVTFIDSTGLGVLVGGLKRARSHGGDLAVVGPSERVRMVFEITRLDAALDIVDDIASLPPPVVIP